MKPIRVTISASIIVAALIVIFFIPLPVTRIRQHGIVQVQPTEITQVAVEVPGILKQLLVKEGQFVKKGKELAHFESMELESQRDQINSTLIIKDRLLLSLNEAINKEQASEQPTRLRDLYDQRQKAKADHETALVASKRIEREIVKLTLVAPRDGVVIGLPNIDEVGKRWDKEQNTLFCSIGDKTKLRVLVPLSPADYHLLNENLERMNATRTTLQATIRVQGHDSKLWSGRISQLPKSDAKEIPVQLSNKAGGPVAVKPTSEPNKLVPQSQVFLVGIDFEKPDDSIAINTQAQVKIHCEYRSCAWWIHRTIASTFDIGLVRW